VPVVNFRPDLKTLQDNGHHHSTICARMSIDGLWGACAEAKDLAVACVASSGGDKDSPELLGRLGSLWTAVENLHAGYEAALETSARALRQARDECASLQQAARIAHDVSVANIQRAAAAADDARVARGGTEAALSSQREALSADSASWKAEYAAQMQALVTGAVRQAREAARLAHEAALDAALARLAETYKAQLSRADASLAELQFFLAGAVQERDAAVGALRGAEGGRVAAAAEAVALRAELATAKAGLAASEQCCRELRAELRHRDGSAQLARRIELEMEQLALARHGTGRQQPHAPTRHTGGKAAEAAAFMAPPLAAGNGSRPC
jgi:hypothetical protein